MYYVLDTSVVLQWFHQTGELHPKEAKRLLDDFRSGKIELLMPDILPVELLNALIKGKGLSSEEANKIVNDLFTMPMRILEISLPVLKESSTLMEKYNIASYDAYFLALAKREECKLISDDSKAHGRITDGSILMLSDYPAA